MISVVLAQAGTQKQGAAPALKNYVADEQKKAPICEAVAPSESASGYWCRTGRMVGRQPSVAARRSARAPLPPRPNPILRHSEAPCATADAPGASGDRARHHPCDDDADDAALADDPSRLYLWSRDGVRRSKTASCCIGNAFPCQIAEAALGQPALARVMIRRSPARAARATGPQDRAHLRLRASTIFQLVRPSHLLDAGCRRSSSCRPSSRAVAMCLAMIEIEGQVGSHLNPGSTHKPSSSRTSTYALTALSRSQPVTSTGRVTPVASVYLICV